MNKKIGQAIVAHNHWKFDLKNAIKSGKSDLTIEMVSNPHACTFGKWLNCAERKKIARLW
ncbi:hypothetical protein BGP_0047 [Beggiatoa sp. PS]|nr:hypothetical protein BGP_0047 [Beggiatoa sp. PS]